MSVANTMSGDEAERVTPDVQLSDAHIQQTPGTSAPKASRPSRSARRRANRAARKSAKAAIGIDEGGLPSSEPGSSRGEDGESEIARLTAQIRDARSQLTGHHAELLEASTDLISPIAGVQALGRLRQRVKVHETMKTLEQAMEPLTAVRDIVQGSLENESDLGILRSILAHQADESMTPEQRSLGTALLVSKLSRKTKEAWEIDVATLGFRDGSAQTLSALLSNKDESATRSS